MDYSRNRYSTEAKIITKGKEYYFSGITGELIEKPVRLEEKNTKSEMIPLTRPQVSGKWEKFMYVWKGMDGDKIYWVTDKNEVYHITYLK